MRSKKVSDVSYLIALGLVKGGDTFHGRILVEFNLAGVQDKDFTEGGDNSECLFIDYKGKLVKEV